MLILYKGHFFFFFFLKEIRVDILQHFQDPLLNNVFQHFLFFYFLAFLYKVGDFCFLD